MKPTVSIVVPHYNYGMYLRDCLVSLACNSYPYFEVIIVDDLSTENGVPDRPGWMSNDSNLTTIYHKQNKGVAATINTGIRASKGEFIMIVSADDMITKCSIEGRIDMFCSDKDLDVIYGPMLKVQGSVDYETSIAASAGLPIHPSKFTVPMYRRRVFEKFGLLHEPLRSKEDKEIQIRLGVHRNTFQKQPLVKFVRCDFPVYFYRRHELAQRKRRSKDMDFDICTIMEFDKRCKDIEINGITAENTEFLK